MVSKSCTDIELKEHVSFVKLFCLNCFDILYTQMNIGTSILDQCDTVVIQCCQRLKQITPVL